MGLQIKGILNANISCDRCGIVSEQRDVEIAVESWSVIDEQFIYLNKNQDGEDEIELNGAEWYCSACRPPHKPSETALMEMMSKEFGVNFVDVTPEID